MLPKAQYHAQLCKGEKYTLAVGGALGQTCIPHAFHWHCECIKVSGLGACEALLLPALQTHHLVKVCSQVISG